MDITSFVELRIGSFIYNVNDKDIRRTASQFMLDRLPGYADSGAVMWTRPAFDGEGGGRDIPLPEAKNWEPIPLNVWEVKDQDVINRFIIQQQAYILNRLNNLRRI